MTKVLPNKPIKLPVTTGSMLSQRLTRTILFGTAVTKTLVVADIAEVMVLVAHVDTNSTNHDQLDARVTVVTVLVYGLPLCHERGRLGFLQL